MSADFVKVYPGFFEGSLRDQPPFARLLFLAMLSKADEHGVVLGTNGFWAAYVGITKEQVEQALEILSSPDPESTSPEEEGRRIVKWGDGANRWLIVNYKSYYQKSRNEERKEYKREWDRKNADNRHKSGSKRGNPTEPDKPDPENENENEKKTKVFKPPKVGDVEEYMASRGWRDPAKNAEQFIAHYEAVGWVYGKTRKPVRSWKACVITWERSGRTDDGWTL